MRKLLALIVIIAVLVGAALAMTALAPKPGPGLVLSVATDGDSFTGMDDVSITVTAENRTSGDIDPLSVVLELPSGLMLDDENGLDSAGDQGGRVNLRLPARQSETLSFKAIGAGSLVPSGVTASYVLDDGDAAADEGGVFQRLANLVSTKAASLPALIMMIAAGVLFLLMLVVIFIGFRDESHKVLAVGVLLILILALMGATLLSGIGVSARGGSYVETGTRVFLDGRASTIRVKASADPADPRLVTGSLAGKVCRAEDRYTGVPNADIDITRDGASVQSLRTDQDGNFMLDLPAGVYRLRIAESGRAECWSWATVEAYGQTVLEPIRLVRTGGRNGQAKGRLANSLTGAGMEGLELIIARDLNRPADPDAVSSADIAGRVTTGADGAYAIDLAPGYFTALAAKDGFVNAAFNIIVEDGDAPDQNGTITPFITEDNYRFTLTWGRTPTDVDAHLEGWRRDGTMLHVYYSDKIMYDGGAVVSSLDVDDTTSFGPENITLDPFLDDKPYYFYLYNFSGDAPLTASDSKIVVHKGNKRIAEFNVPIDENEGKYWNVFAVKNDRLIVRNTMTNEPELDYAN